jgi:hypothetical protein|uniref:hypothetical protein n=1 Tax=Cephaloticoccus sp. TaxID=1985742 RepID=UPI00404B4AF7
MQRQDYILRMIGELQQFVRGAIGTGGPSGAKEALHAVMHAQQQLFQRPVAEVIALALTEQIELLGQGYTPEVAAEKVATYAAILEEGALVYDAMERTDLAFSSRQLALSALLTAAIRWPEATALFDPDIDKILAELMPGDLNPVVQEMLREWDAPE